MWVLVTISLPAHQRKTPESHDRVVTLPAAMLTLGIACLERRVQEMRITVIVTTTQDVPGREITEIAGLARGNSVRARHAGRDIMAAMRNLVGGEITEYATLQAETREMATRRMVEQAETMGADAVVSVRYTTSMIASGASEILAYGTAVKLG
jgi:uncharacterized protein YbjQ (UPF0145 family)